ncbi:hypothetical protein [Acinetobacter sp. TGL-Y2]|nr:hypothetical protein [Acinetobacter sp. TGL-Y2]
MDNTELFLEKFYKAEQEHRVLKIEKEARVSASQKSGGISNYSDYIRSKI